MTNARRARPGRRQSTYWKLNARYLRYVVLALCVSLAGHVAYLLYGPAPEARPYTLPPQAVPPEVWDLQEWVEPEPPKAVDPPELPTDIELTDDDDLGEVENVPATTWGSVPWGWRPAPRSGAGPFQYYHSPPVPIRRVVPDYPDIARQARAEGEVRVLITIDASGRVVDAEIKSSTGIPSLQHAALVAARQWLFKPAMQRDTPVSCRIELPFTFRLR